MAKVAVRAPQDAASAAAPEGISGAAELRAYFDGARDPVHLHVAVVRRGDVMRLDATAIDRLAYVWEGEVAAGGRRLARGSSLIVEHGAALEIVGRGEEAKVALFAAGRLRTDAAAGGKVHLLPCERVPRVASGAGSEASGGLHAAGALPGCTLWLNENSLPGRDAAPSPAEAWRGIHAHPEDEIIFVTEGQMRLGARLVERGTALAVARDTLYGFAPGPAGVTFITFRPSGATGIRFAGGGNDYVESTYFARAAEALAYLEPLADG